MLAPLARAPRDGRSTLEPMNGDDQDKERSEEHMRAKRLRQRKATTVDHGQRKPRHRVGLAARDHHRTHVVQIEVRDVAGPGQQRQRRNG